MDLQRLSHVNYAFFDLTPSCKVASGDPYATTDKKNAEVGQTWSSDAMPGGTMGAFRIMRCGDDVPNCDVAKANGHYYPHIKLLVSLGGWTWSKQFSQCTKDAGRRRTFVSSAVDAMVRTLYEKRISFKLPVTNIFYYIGGASSRWT
jgi:GH18 family chitinase